MNNSACINLLACLLQSFYKNFEHFLEINGFANEKEFKKAAKASIIAKYRKGEIKPYFYDYWSTVSELNSGKGK